MKSSSSEERTKNPGRIASSENQRPSSASPSTDQRGMCTTSSRKRTRRRNRGGSETQFPGKLFDMLEYAEENDLDSVVSWIREGTAFMVHDPEKLVDVLPMFFGQTKYRSFRRQLNMWHFHRILEGPDRGAFMHPCFIRENKQLCSYMSRHGFMSHPASYNLDDRSRYEECRIESVKLDEPLELADSSKALLSPFPVMKSSETSPQNQEIEIFEPSCIRLTESPIVSSPLEKLPGISVAGLSDGDALTFAGRKFHFLDNCRNNKSPSGKKISAVPSFKDYQELSKNSAAFQLDAFRFDAPMIVSDALLEPIDPETIDSLFSLSP